MKVYVVMVSYAHEGLGPPENAYLSEEAAQNAILEKYGVYSEREVFEVDVEGTP